MPPHHDVFQRRHFSKQAYVLKCAGNPSLGYFVNSLGLVRLASQFKTAAVW